MSVTTFPDASLIPSATYYTEIIGGGLGSVVVMTGGGSNPGIGDPSGRNDDGFSGPVALGFSFEFFGNTYTHFWINNNGNISFNNGIATWVPSGPQGAAEPCIAPFFGDVDTRDPPSGVVYFRNNTPNQVIVTWDQVSRYNRENDGFNSFQLVIRGPGYAIPAGEGAIGFFWKTMEWDKGNASGSVPAAIGFGDGASNGVVLESSLETGISGIVSNHHTWFNLELEPVPPAPLPVFPFKTPRKPAAVIQSKSELGIDVGCVLDADESWSLVSGETNLAHALARRLSTPRGGLFYAPDYGFDVRTLLGADLTGAEIATVAATIAGECEKDERVQSCAVDLSFNFARETLSIAITVTTASGPFRFILEVSALTIELLSLSTL